MTLLNDVTALREKLVVMSVPLADSHFLWCQVFQLYITYVTARCRTQLVKWRTDYTNDPDSCVCQQVR